MGGGGLTLHTPLKVIAGHLSKARASVTRERADVMCHAGFRGGRPTGRTTAIHFHADSGSSQPCERNINETAKGGLVASTLASQMLWGKRWGLMCDSGERGSFTNRWEDEKT